MAEHNRIIARYPDIKFTPLNLGDVEFEERVKAAPVTTFRTRDPMTKEFKEMRIPQLSFFSETTTTVPPIVLQSRDEDDYFEFRKLIDTNVKQSVDYQWASFAIFKSWLETGEYENNLMIASHVDVYLLAEKIQSPRFANAIMKKFLRSITNTGWDETLAPVIRSSFRVAREDSLLKKLYFDTANYWFHKSPKRADGCLKWIDQGGYCKGIGVIEKADKDWLRALDRHTRETCKCSKTKTTAHISLEDDEPKQYVPDCEDAPWLDKPTRYFFQ